VVFCSLISILAIAGLNALAGHPAGKGGQIAWYICRFVLGFAVFLGTTSLLKMPEARSAWSRLTSVLANIARFISDMAGLLQRKEPSAKLSGLRQKQAIPQDSSKEAAKGASRQALSHLLGKHAARRDRQDAMRERLGRRLKPALAAMATRTRSLMRSISARIRLMWRKIADWFKDSQPLE
jgi:hypothetical protein